MKETELNKGDKIGYFRVFRNSNNDDVLEREIEIIRTTKTLAFSKYGKFKRIQFKDKWFFDLSKGHDHPYAYKLIK